MVDATVRFGRDTWAGLGKPNDRHNGANRLRLQSGSSYAFVYLKTPVPPLWTVVSAKWQVFVAKTSDWTGTKTVKARRISSEWKPGKLTWNNKPGVTGTTQPTVTVTNAVDGQMLEFDVTVHLQTVSNGSAHWGWRLETDSATAHRIYGFDSPYPPRLVVTYVDKPSVPTDLVPQGGAVSVAKPYLSFSATDLTNPGEISHIQIQIDPAASTAAPQFDTGWIQRSVTELAPDDPAYTWVGLAGGASTQWRVRVRGVDGAESAWSPWVTFSRAVKGTITITNPATTPNNYVTESTPPIIATSTVPLDSAEVLIVNPDDPTEVFVESEPFDMAGGTTINWSIPAGVIHDGQTYRLVVRGTDTVTRVETPGDPEYVDATRDFAFQQDVSVSAPGSLTGVGSDPWATLTWVRATAPDSWTILRDGKNIASDVSPADTLVSGTTHSWRDPEAQPMVPHVYEVRAVVNGKASPKSNAATVTAKPTGVWVIDAANGRSFVLAGVGIEDWTRTDQAGIHQVIGGPKVVIKTGKTGLEGSYLGMMRAGDGRTLESLRADLKAIDRRGDVPVQLVAANLSIRVVLLDLTDAPHPETTHNDPRDAVSFRFVQVP